MTLRFRIGTAVESMVERYAPAASTVSERDTILAQRFTSLDNIWTRENGSGVTVETDDELLHAYGRGPTMLAYELQNARTALSGSELGMWVADGSDQYGIALKFTKRDGMVSVARSFRTTELGPPSSVKVPLDDFAEGVEEYLHWFHTMYTAEASWLLQSPSVQQMRVADGFPPDRLRPS